MSFSPPQRMESIWMWCLLSVFVLLTASGDADMNGFNSSFDQPPPIFFGPEVTVNITCLNGGSIIDGKCRCQPRFEGERCEIEPCLNGGMRSPSSPNGKCHCPYGLTGEKCEQVTHCVEGKGKLIDGQCKCADRWTGLFCQTRTCYNGISVGTGAETFCLCDIGFAGPFCDSNIVCVHGAISSENACVCDPHWVGESCDRCAIDHRLEDDECRLIVAEESLIAVTNQNTVDIWPLIVVGCAALVLIVFVALSVTVVLKRFKAKPSRVGSEAGTDV